MIIVLRIGVNDIGGSSDFAWGEGFMHDSRASCCCRVRMEIWRMGYVEIYALTPPFGGGVPGFP